MMHRALASMLLESTVPANLYAIGPSERWEESIAVSTAAPAWSLHVVDEARNAVRTNVVFLTGTEHFGSSSLKSVTIGFPGAPVWGGREQHPHSTVPHFASAVVGVGHSAASLDYHLVATLRDTDEYLIDEHQLGVFNRRVELALSTGRENAARRLLTFLNQQSISYETVEAICDAVGRVMRDDARPIALLILTTLLGHQNPSNREAAALGLALLNDTRALPALEQALRDAQSELLGETYRQVISQIQTS